MIWDIFLWIFGGLVVIACITAVVGVILLAVRGVEIANQAYDYYTNKAELDRELAYGREELDSIRQETTHLKHADIKQKIVEKTRRLKSLTRQQNNLISLNDNMLKILDEKERNYEKKKQKIRQDQEKIRGQFVQVEGEMELCILMKRDHEKTKNDLELREISISKAEEIEKSKADDYVKAKKIEADELIHQAKRKNGVALKENQKYIATQKKQAVEDAKKIISEAKKKENLFTETIEKLSINTPIKNIEQVLLEKYKSVESVDVKEKQSLAHICDAIRMVLEKTGHDIPEFLNMVNASPITVNQDAFMLAMKKFERDIDEVEKDDSIESSRKELLIDQYKEYWDREFQMLLDN